MFYDKLNYKEDGFYSVVDQVELTNGEYKGVLNHDHVDRGTILIIDEEGNEIKDYFISDNPEKPWETEIELFGPKGVKIAYIHYNTKGDIVDADDINKIQDVISKDDGALDKVKEDIIVLKETKSDKRYVDRELNKKLDNDSFLEVMEEVADKKADKDKIIDIVNQNIKDLDIEDEVHHVSGIEEANIVRDFENGITISPVSNRNQFPSIDAFGVSITFINKLNGGYGQMVITSNGDTWTRRTNSLTSWDTWYSAKSEIDKKADKDYVDEKIGDIDFTTLEIEIDKKADKDYVDEKIGDIDFTTLEIEIDKKADKDYVDNKISNIDINQFEAIDKAGYSFNNLKEPGVYRLWNSSTSPCGSTTDYITAVFTYHDKITQVAYSSTTNSQQENRVYTRYYTGSRWTSWRELTADNTARSNTIVIANYDSKDSSKKGADIVINKGENAAKKINDAIQSLKGTGGEVKLMEGKYQLNSKISILVDNITLTGAGRATELIANDLPSSSMGSLVEVGEYSNISNNQVRGCTISNLIVNGNNIKENYRGVGLSGAVKTTISNVECSNNGVNGIQLTNSSSATISNVECSNNGVNGIGLWDSSSATISNVECSNNGVNGIGLWDSSSATISNVECSNNISAGVGIYSSSPEVSVSNSLIKNNRINPEFVNYAQLEVGGHVNNNAKNILVTNCKIIDTTGKTRGVSIRGDYHAFLNNQFVGNFKEKINDTSSNSIVRDNVGV